MNIHINGAVFTSIRGDRITFFDMAACHFEEMATSIFTAAEGLEFLSLEAFEKEKLGQATIFTTIESLAQTHGLQTDGTFGGLTEAIGLDQQDAHQIGCACNGPEVIGSEIAKRLRERVASLR